MTDLSENAIYEIVSETNITFNVDVLKDEVATALNNNIEVNYITQCIRCSVHTFQLCVESGLNETSIQKLLTKTCKENMLKLFYFIFNTFIYLLMHIITLTENVKFCR